MMNRLYGEYTIRERVSHVGVGYKTADLLWPTVNSGCTEVDYPELEHDDTPTGFYHYKDCNRAQESFSTGKAWTDWHTYTTTWTPSYVHYWIDGVLVGSVNSAIPDVTMSWDIQNESALNGESAAPNSYDQIDIDYVKGYSWNS
jgi:beta-glucanase (GH16 family)